MENPLEGVHVVALPTHPAREVDSPPPPQPSNIFARPKENVTPEGLPLPSLKWLLDLLNSIRAKARELLQSPGLRTMRAHATLRNAFRDVLVTPAHAPRPPSTSTVDLVDVTALILEASLVTLSSHPGILRFDTPLPYT
jgi:hypothetical protein